MKKKKTSKRIRLVTADAFMLKGLAEVGVCSLSRSVWYKLEESGQEPVAATSTWSSESPAFSAQQQAPPRTTGDSFYQNICRGVRK